jgi:hypothetical protein
MTDPVLVTKVCRGCRVEKTGSEFYVRPSFRGGLDTYCKTCRREQVRQRAAQARAEMGDELWRDLNRRIVAKSRATTGNVNGRAYNKARSDALEALKNRHRTEFEHLFLLARRGELDQIAVGTSPDSHLGTRTRPRVPGSFADVPPTSATPAPEDVRPVVNGAGRGQSSAPPPPSGAPTAVPGNAARFPGTAPPNGDAA